MSIKEKKAVLLVNLGTIDSPTPSGVRTFLKEFLSDKRVVDLPRLIWYPILYCIVLPLRVKRVAKAYDLIWYRGASYKGVPNYNPTKGVSPLMYHSLSLAAQVQERIGENTAIVRAAMCYNDLNVNSVLTKLHEEHPEVTSVVVLPLFPQYSSTTTACIFDRVFEFYQNPFRRNIPALFMVREYYKEQLYIEAVSRSILEELKKFLKFKEGASWSDVLAPIKHEFSILLSFHSIPVRFNKTGDDYPLFCADTTRLITEWLEKEMKMPLKDIVLQVFQSQFGKEPWIEPFLAEALEVLPLETKKAENREKKKKFSALVGNSLYARKVTKVCLAVTPGFSADCLETLEEVGCSGKETFIENGGREFLYVPCLNSSPQHADAITAVVKKYINLSD